MRGVEPAEIPRLVEELNAATPPTLPLSNRQRSAGFRLALRDAYRSLREQFFGPRPRGGCRRPCRRAGDRGLSAAATAEQISHLRGKPSSHVLAQWCGAGCLRIERISSPRASPGTSPRFVPGTVPPAIAGRSPAERRIGVILEARAKPLLLLTRPLAVERWWTIVPTSVSLKEHEIMAGNKYTRREALQAAAAAWRRPNVIRRMCGRRGRPGATNGYTWRSSAWAAGLADIAKRP